MRFRFLLAARVWRGLRREVSRNLRFGTCRLGFATCRVHFVLFAPRSGFGRFAVGIRFSLRFRAVCGAKCFKTCVLAHAAWASDIFGVFRRQAGAGGRGQKNEGTEVLVTLPLL